MATRQHRREYAKARTPCMPHWEAGSQIFWLMPWARKRLPHRKDWYTKLPAQKDWYTKLAAQIVMAATSLGVKSRRLVDRRIIILDTANPVPSSIKEAATVVTTASSAISARLVRRRGARKHYLISEVALATMPTIWKTTTKYTLSPMPSSRPRFQRLSNLVLRGTSTLNCCRP